MENYKFDNLKTIDEYKKELIEIHNEIGIGLATGTLIKSDMDLLTRADELVIIIEFLKNKENE